MSRCLQSICFVLLLGLCCVSTAANPPFKGLELYYWTKAGEGHYALMPGTNRLKTAKEVEAAELPRNEMLKQLSWPDYHKAALVLNSPVQELPTQLPLEDDLQEIERISKENGMVFSR